MLFVVLFVAVMTTILYGSRESSSSVCVNGLSMGGAPSSRSATASSPPTVVRRLLDRVRGNDRAGDASNSALSFVVGGQTMGKVLPQTAAVAFSGYPSVFSVDYDRNAVTLVDDPSWLLSSSEEEKKGEEEAAAAAKNKLLVEKRSRAVADAMSSLREADIVPALRGWRDEPYAVRESFYAPPVLLVERACAVLLGVPSYGVFLNGYTCEDDNNNRGRDPTHVWIGKRSPTKATWPGKLDCLAAGGLAAGMLPREAMVKECREEAGIPKKLLLDRRRLRAVSAVSYTGFSEDRWGPKRDALFCFDLELPPGFRPTAVDGEMDGFRKVPVPVLLDMLAEPVLADDDSDNEWKTNVGVVLVDFLVRHGKLDANDPSFLELIGALRTAGCS